MATEAEAFANNLMEITIREANLGDPDDVQALVEIIDSYARGPGGQDRPLTLEARANLGKGLREYPSYFVLLAVARRRIVGAAVCQLGFSTFAGRPFANVHDLAVLPEFQNRGIGGRLLEAVEERARERGCCKITLDVYDTNEGAKRLYRRHGFGPWEPARLFVSKSI